MEQNISNENCGSASWKSRLEDPAILAPNSGTDTNELWQKLYARLEKKPRRNKVAAWYWVAAACLIAAILLPLFNNNLTKNGISKTAGIKELPAGTTAKVTNMFSAAPIEKSGHVGEKTQTLKIVNKNASTSIVPDNSVQEAGIALNSPIVQNDIQPLTKTVLEDSNTAVAIATARPVLNQKLKVVHINELGYPGQVTIREEHLANYRSIRFNPVSSNVYTSTSSAQNINDLNFFQNQNISIKLK